MSVITTAVHTVASIPAGEWAQDLSNPAPNMGAPGVNQWATLAGFLKGWGIVILGLVALAGAVSCSASAVEGTRACARPAP
jgi:hypothetical protein